MDNAYLCLSRYGTLHCCSRYLLIYSQSAVFFEGWGYECIIPRECTPFPMDITFALIRCIDESLKENSISVLLLPGKIASESDRGNVAANMI